MDVLISHREHQFFEDGYCITYWCGPAGEASRKQLFRVDRNIVCSRWNTGLQFFPSQYAQGDTRPKARRGLLVQNASVNVDCRKAEWLEFFISCIIGCHTPARVVKEDEERRCEPHGTPKHNSELCSRIAHYSTARDRHFWRNTTDTPSGSSQDGD